MPLHVVILQCPTSIVVSCFPEQLRRCPSRKEAGAGFGRPALWDHAPLSSEGKFISAWLVKAKIHWIEPSMSPSNKNSNNKNRAAYLYEYLLYSCSVQSSFHVFSYLPLMAVLWGGCGLSWFFKWDTNTWAKGPHPQSWVRSSLWTCGMVWQLSSPSKSGSDKSSLHFSHW